MHESQFVFKPRFPSFPRGRYPPAFVWGALLVLEDRWVWAVAELRGDWRDGGLGAGFAVGFRAVLLIREAVSLAEALWERVRVFPAFPQSR